MKSLYTCMQYLTKSCITSPQTLKPCLSVQPSLSAFMISKASIVAQKPCREQLARFKVCSSKSTCRIPTSFHTTVPL